MNNNVLDVNNNKKVAAGAEPKLTADHFNLRQNQVQGSEHFIVTFGKLLDGTEIFDENFALCVDSWQLPSKTTNVENMSWFNGVVKLAGRTTFGDLTASFKDFIDYDTASRLELWAAKVNNLKTGMRGFKDAYACTAYVDVYSPNGSQYRRWKYTGLWPSAISYPAMSYSQPGYVMVSVTFQYDYAYPESIEAISKDILTTDING